MNKAEKQIPQNKGTASAMTSEEEGIRVNGYRQVIEMLRFADPSFRESLLKRLAKQNPQLAKNLRREL